MHFTDKKCILLAKIHFTCKTCILLTKFAFYWKKYILLAKFAFCRKSSYPLTTKGENTLFKRLKPASFATILQKHSPNFWCATARQISLCILLARPFAFYWQGPKKRSSRLKNVFPNGFLYCISVMQVRARVA